MKYYIIAGEASGDLHGSNLIKELHHIDTAANIRCWGGDLMQQAGATLVKHYRDLAFMGFAEVIKNLPAIFKNIAFCKQDILNYQPNVLVLIDYPGFNLRISKWAKTKNIKVVYYISPQVWAWKENRVKEMKQSIDKMLVILPFEKDYYQHKWHWDVEYVGHPLVDVIEQYQKNAPQKITANKPIIAILPGSRKQEIAVKLPVMLQVAAHFPEYEFKVAQAPGQEDAFYTPFLAPYQNVSIVKNNTYGLLCSAKAALVTSGTATLETALFGVPEVVCYKGSAISFAIAKRIVKIKYICLVNLIMDKPVVKELIQQDMTVTNIINELTALLTDEVKLQALKKDYAALKTLLQAGGHASFKAANRVFETAQKAE
ncbi:MAG: lipid-A-disaccharide synthase [Sphingobacteriales bacterium]|uniref:lipid-A-disaccharide synthase n=1 Tax=Hydrotalea flava TaxID=714549 RepID=UPI0008331E41|nr:lipid-A-disaccharide synthase [Hydrotalea flava]RTL54777.1 MAG: lipid-A-disaccharide synthase [Sphingobacteriales bacterium]